MEDILGSEDTWVVDSTWDKHEDACHRAVEDPLRNLGEEGMVEHVRRLEVDTWVDSIHLEDVHLDIPRVTVAHTSPQRRETL